MPGIIESYIHTGNCIGVLVEISCQSDWCVRTLELKALAKDIAIQITACSDVKYIKIADISAEVIQQVKALEISQEDLRDQPTNFREKIVQRRVEKRLKEMCLLEQPYIRDPNITVEDLIKVRTAQLAENIQIRRFVRFIVDEFENPPSDFGISVPNRPLPNSPNWLGSKEVE